ncbi:MAG: pyridoxamine 5'-phosphate oxidase [Bacteroidales bacterium]|jgi:pyridoxamine 5'-phosphate oxidase|nr:pyridoxamine 5'-phosphate oxidase [Bacteroidales bacterium]
MKSVRQLITVFRAEYISQGINVKDIADNPIDQFDKWIEDAIKNKVNLPNAMYLATIGTDGRPSGRIMLLRGFDERGFVFFTNHDSRKGNDLKNINYASMTFFWSELFRQVRIEGDVYQVPEWESDKYFQSRARESQVSAMASEQSKILDSRGSLEKKVSELEQRFKGQPIPRPANWGGFYLSPIHIEFWQGRAHRLHDRILYKLDKNNSWNVQRLYP